MESDRLAGYPRWLQDIVAGADPLKDLVVNHEVWRRMRAGTITLQEHRNVFVGFWPLINKFPHYLGLNLLKTTYGDNPGINRARAWLAKNLRIEQLHAEWYMDLAESFGVPREEVFDGWAPVEMTAIADWCWHICETGDICEGMAATNYAIEGATGDWTRTVAHNETYQTLLLHDDTEKAMRWLRVHADYDDTHPWDALEIIAQILGDNPPSDQVRRIGDGMCKSFELYRMSLDAILDYADDDRCLLPANQRRPYAAAGASAAALS